MRNVAFAAVLALLAGCANKMPSVDPIPKVENCAKGELCVPDAEKRVIKRVADNQ